MPGRSPACHASITQETARHGLKPRGPLDSTSAAKRLDATLFDDFAVLQSRDAAHEHIGRAADELGADEA